MAKPSRPRSLTEKLVAAGYERVELVEGRGQIAARGDLVDVYTPGSEYPVRIEFFGDEIDQMRWFDPVTQRSVEQTNSVVIRPALETPQPRERTMRALKKITGKVGLMDQEQAWSDGVSSVGGDVLLPILYEHRETLFDYLASDAIIELDEALLIDDALRTEQLRFSEAVQAMLEREEGIPEQGALEHSANETLDRLHTSRTALLYALSRTHPQFSRKKLSRWSPEERHSIWAPWTNSRVKSAGSIKRANALLSMPESSPPTLQGGLKNTTQKQPWCNRFPQRFLQVKRYLFPGS